jgi:hypothetical protein
MIITMAVHPHGTVTPAQIASVARNLTIVHALALISMILLFLGVLGLTRRLKRDDRLDLAALVLFAFASVAVMNAIVADGLVAPSIMRLFVQAGPGTPAGDTWRILSRYNLEVNQADARLYAVVSSLAVLLWSISIVRTRRLGRGVGIYGCVTGVATVIAVSTGIPMDVHRFGAIVLGQAIWSVIVGATLCSFQEDGAAQSGR